MTSDRAYAARAACESVLGTSDHRRIAQALLKLDVDPAAFLLGLAVHRSAAAQQQLTRIHQLLDHADAEGVVEHHLLLTVARLQLGSVESLPVTAAVKQNLYGAFVTLAGAEGKLRDRLRAGNAWLRSAALIVALRRFPAGEFEWEISGVPRSWLIKVERRRLPELIRLLWRARGMQPFFSPHLSILREPGARLQKAAVLEGYLEMARTLTHQPDVKGMVAASWLRDPRLRDVSPHLFDTITRPIVEGGGFIADLGPVDALKSGALRKSRVRRELYGAGAYRPRSGMVLWPRDRMLQWAACMAPP